MRSRPDRPSAQRRGATAHDLRARATARARPSHPRSRGLRGRRRRCRPLGPRAPAQREPRREPLRRSPRALPPCPSCGPTGDLDDQRDIHRGRVALADGANGPQAGSRTLPWPAPTRLQTHPRAHARARVIEGRDAPPHPRERGGRVGAWSGAGRSGANPGFLARAHASTSMKRSSGRGLGAGGRTPGVQRR